MSRILAVDLGDARTGLAICDQEEILSRPLSVIHSRKTDEILSRVAAAAKSEQVQMIVIGNPLNMDGSAGERSQKSKHFVFELEPLVPEISVVLWDERLTTVSAIYYMNENNIRGKKRKNQIDAEAAAILLESYLRFRKNQKKDTIFPE